MAEKIDLRLDVGFVNHPKTKELKAELGLIGPWCLLTLWCYCRQYKPTGDLSGKTDAFIEEAAGWPTDRRGEFIAALLRSGYIEGPQNGRAMHDWDDHQRWALGSDDRQRIARLGGLIRSGKTREQADNILNEEEKKRVLRAQLSAQLSAQPRAKRVAGKKAATSSAPLPSPSPPPSPSPSPSLFPASDEAQSKSTAGESKTPPPPESNGPIKPTVLVWNAYRKAYTKRYGTEPVRNATINGQISQFVTRIPIEEAPLVAAFYVEHGGAYYVRSMHPVGALLKDAEKLRTEWATQRQMTSTAAADSDRRTSNADVANLLIEEYRNGKFDPSTYRLG